MINRLPDEAKSNLLFIWFSHDNGKSWAMDANMTSPFNNVHQAMDVAKARCADRKWQIRDGNNQFIAGFQVFGE
jgi:hypothetical protein